jgi:hypothetical protein
MVTVLHGYIKILKKFAQYIVIELYALTMRLGYCIFVICLESFIICHTFSVLTPFGCLF